jgi:Flp pilus assembly pilin Flp
MRNQIALMMKRLESEEGQALAEYGLLLALVTIVCVAALTALGIAIGVPLGDAAAGLAGAGS